MSDLTGTAWSGKRLHLASQGQVEDANLWLGSADGEPSARGVQGQSVAEHPEAAEHCAGLNSSGLASRFQTLAVLSAPAVTRRVPSGVTAKPTTAPSCTGNERTSLPSADVEDLDGLVVARREGLLSLGRKEHLAHGIGDAEVAERTAEADPHANSDLLYTSGTTGQAKGAMLRHDALLRTAYSSAYTRAFADGRRILYALPIYHVFGYIEGLVAALFVGGAICPHPTFVADKILRDIGTHRIDELICVPAMTTEVLTTARAGDYDLSSLSVMFSSGAAHSPGMFPEMQDVLGVDELFTAYGQTETTASTTCTQPGDPIDRLAGTNGCLKPAGVAGDPELGGVLAVYRTVHPGTGATLPVGEVGELVVRGPIVTHGYYDKSAETAALFTEDGWMRTGDLGRIDENGYLILTGRTKESYRCGGELVLPGEIEKVLADHPAVLAAHVVGIPHPRMGEVGCAWVVSTPDRPSSEDLIAYCASRLARFKVPAAVLFAEAHELPTTVTGRVQKFLLTQRAVTMIEQGSVDPAPIRTS